jgi:DNA-binding protein HU-beta
LTNSRENVITVFRDKFAQNADSHKTVRILFYYNEEEDISMNKTELITAVAEKAEISKRDSEKAVKAFVDVITEELKKGEKVQVVGFGTFEVSERAAREGRNPQTGETMKINACKAPKFKAGKALKDAVNE